MSKTINKATRVLVWEKYGHHCAYCGKYLPFDKMQVDHLFPQRLKHYFRNPQLRIKYNLPESINHINNLMPSCGSCNHYKRSYLLEGFRKLMKTIHKRILANYICKVAEDYGIIKVIPWDGVFYFEKQMKRTKKSKKELYNSNESKQRSFDG